MAQTDAEPYIARYRGHARAAFSYTFDDGRLNEVRDALRIIEPLGLRGTFFVMPLAMQASPNAFIGWEELRAIAGRGHEVGTHAQIKPKLEDADDKMLETIVNGGWRLIRDRVGVAPVSFAYPGGSSHDDARVRSVVAANHPFVRGKYIGYGSAGKRVWSPETAKEQVLAAIEKGERITAVVHSIVGGYAPFESVQQFREYCEWLVAQQTQLWIAPMGEVERYVREQEFALLTTRGRYPRGVDFEVDFKIQPASLYGEPLTVVIPVAGIKEAEASVASGEKLPVVVREQELLVEVPRDAGLVRVEWKLGDDK